MKKTRLLWKRFWNLKNFVFLVSVVFIVGAIVCLILYISNCTSADCFKDVSLIVASIAVGLIPIALSINEKDERNKRQLLIEHNNAVEDIEKLRLLDIDSKHLFIRRVLETFYSKYGLNSLCESFINFKSNAAFYQSVNQIVSNSSLNVWENLVNAIDACLYFLPNGSSLKDSTLTSNDKLDLFLAMMVNEMEIIDVMCYRYLTMKIEKKMFDVFEKKPVLRMYSHSYYLLVELRINERFKYIDSVCAIIKSEEEGINNESTK